MKNIILLICMLSILFAVSCMNEPKSEWVAKVNKQYITKATFDNRFNSYLSSLNQQQQQQLGQNPHIKTVFLNQLIDEEVKRIIDESKHIIDDLAQKKY